MCKTMISYNNFLTKVLYKNLFVSTGFFKMDMNADHVLIGGEIEDISTEASITVKPTDNIYEIYEDDEILFEIKDEDDNTKLYIFVRDTT